MPETEIEDLKHRIDGLEVLVYSLILIAYESPFAGMADLSNWNRDAGYVVAKEIEGRLIQRGVIRV